MPEVSVVIPAYDTDRTIAGCLTSLAGQSFRDFETIVADSSPDGRTEAIVLRRFPEVRYWRSPVRLLAHAALNHGAGMASGRLLAFTDPDAYPRPDWLERLVQAHRETGRVVVGAVACYGRRWMDRGAHLCKFDGWLPGGSRREIDLAATVNVLIDRALFEAEGGFLEVNVHADTDLSWRLRSHGHRLLFEPAAIVEHHHLHTWPSLLKERFQRGREFARLRMARLSPSLVRLSWWAAASLLPIRLASQVWRVGGHAWRSGWFGDHLACLPVVATGRWSWLAGELSEYVPALVGSRRRSVTRPDA
jgi:GT2 family glycosyltransferase